MEYRPAAWDVSPLTSTVRGAVGPRTPFSPERPVEMRNYVEDSMAYPEWDELVDQLVDTATMAPGIDDSSNRGSATILHFYCLQCNGDGSIVFSIAAKFFVLTFWFSMLTQ